MSDVKLEVTDLQWVYPAIGRREKDVVALKDINLEVRESEFVVIVGPSGCGKSTLINLIGGLERVQEGTIRVDGRDVTDPGVERGMVFQGYSLFPWLSVQKNVEFGLKMRKIPKKEREQTAKEYISLVGLEGFANAFPKQLSGGMKQRVAIARTLANHPKILLMDEPFGALDAQTRVVMQELLAKISREMKSTVLFITHDIDEAIYLSDHLYVLKGEPAQLTEHFVIPKSEGFLDSQQYLVLKKQILAVAKRESNRKIIAVP